MKVVTHLTQNEIEEIIVAHIRNNGRYVADTKLKAEIIVELGREETGDPRDQPFTVVKAIRAEIVNED